MGAQVAAHLVALRPRRRAARPGRRRAPTAPRSRGRRWTRCRSSSPRPLHLPEHAARIRPGNFEDDWNELKDADWVFEAVVEDLEVKRQLFARVAAAVEARRAVVTTQHVGPGHRGHVGAPARRASARRFLGTHFFNPPRYLKLLETIPGPDTDAGGARGHGARSADDASLGKGVVRCKDTPNFIGNRIGSYGFGVALQAMQELDLTIEEVDALTGPGHRPRPKSATFRTADIVGVDVCRQGRRRTSTTPCPDDPEREVFQRPRAS